MSFVNTLGKLFSFFLFFLVYNDTLKCYYVICEGVDEMPLSFSEKIKIILKRRGLTIKELADTLGTTRQNLTNKLSRDNFNEKEMMLIAEKLNCTYKNIIVMNDTNEEI